MFPSLICTAEAALSSEAPNLVQRFCLSLRSLPSFFLASSLLSTFTFQTQILLRSNSISILALPPLGSTKPQPPKQIFSEDINPRRSLILNPKPYKQHIIKIPMISLPLLFPAHTRNIKHLRLIPTLNLLRR